MNKIWEVKEVFGAYVANQRLHKPDWTLLHTYTKPKTTGFAEPGEVDVIYVLGRTEPNSLEVSFARVAS